MRLRGALAVNRPVMVSNRLETPDVVLVNRARRILTDGRQHSYQTLQWACRLTGTPMPQSRADEEVLHSAGIRDVRVFCDRELSLGAGR